MAKKEKASKRNLERLFKELLSMCQRYQNPDYRALDQEVDRMRDKLLANSAFVALSNRRDKLYSDLYTKEQAWENQVHSVRREFWAKGPTPAVLKKVDALRRKADRLARVKT